jgi:phage shock protein PspC (stress-responsive transcriptional regulator)
MGDFLLYVFLGLLGLVIYFLPSLLIWNKEKKNATVIFIVNLLAGWTFIGWLAALIWALVGDSVESEEPALKQGELEPRYKYEERLRQATAPAEKKCPDCAELVKAEARKCRFCGHEFDLVAK